MCKWSWWFNITIIHLSSTAMKCSSSYFVRACVFFFWISVLTHVYIFCCLIILGIEVKPGKPYPYHSDNVTGKLRITQVRWALTPLWRWKSIRVFDVFNFNVSYLCNGHVTMTLYCFIWNLLFQCSSGWVPMWFWDMPLPVCIFRIW